MNNVGFLHLERATDLLESKAKANHQGRRALQGIHTSTEDILATGLFLLTGWVFHGLENLRAPDCHFEAVEFLFRLFLALDIQVAYLVCGDPFGFSKATSSLYNVMTDTEAASARKVESSTWTSDLSEVTFHLTPGPGSVVAT